MKKEKVKKKKMKTMASHTALDVVPKKAIDTSDGVIEPSLLKKRLIALEEEEEPKTVEDEIKAALRYTMFTKAPLWMQNFATNIENGLRNRPDIRDIPKRGGAAIVIGAGPSLKAKNHLKMLREFVDKRPEVAKRLTVVAADSILLPCISQGIVPDFVTSIDGDEALIYPYYNHERLRDQPIQAVLTTTIAPNVVKRLEDFNIPMYFFHAIMDDINNPYSTTRNMHFMTGNGMYHVAGNVGAWCWTLSVLLECNPIVCIGIDFAYPKGTRIEQTVYYDALMRKFRGDAKAALKISKGWDDKKKKYVPERKRVWEGTNPVTGEGFVTDHMWRGYKFLLLKYIRDSYTRFGIRTVNASGGGYFYDDEQPDTIAQMQFEDWLTKFAEAQDKHG